MQIRNSVKALIIEDDKILLTKNQDIEGNFYLCPGGGQNMLEKIMSMHLLTLMFIK